MKKTLSNREVKSLLFLIKEKYNLELSKKDKYEIIDNIILINNNPKFFYYEKEIIPTLKLILENNFLKKITIDMGAVKFIASGADVMKPGIINIEKGIKKNEIISIIDTNNKRPIAIGIALFDENEIKFMSSGKVIKNIHHVNDKIWKLTT